MFAALQVLTVMLVAVAAAMALAHALELPGKMRLDRDTYVAVQRIYYPGFTIGGAVGEAGGTLATLLLLFLTPPGTAAFWLVLLALVGLAAVQAVYWTVTHPVNRYWVEGEKMGTLGTGFFSFGTGARSQQGASRSPDWTELRDRWEYSHVARAAFAMASLAALVTSLLVPGAAPSSA